MMSIIAGVKIDGREPILTELWPGEFGLQTSPSQLRTSPGHNSMNIGPLPSIFACKCSLCSLLVPVQSRDDGEKRGTNAAQYSGATENLFCLHIKYSNFS